MTRYLRRLLGLWRIRPEFQLFKRTDRSRRFTMLWKDCRPYLNDRTKATPIDAHYVYHPAWAARILAHTKPEHHVDISSSIHFSTCVSAFVPTTFYDYRPANIRLDSFTSGFADLNCLPFTDQTVPSLSCMHVLEHIGLGRYGDVIDPDGDLKSISELKRVLSPSGSLLVVLPVGMPRIVFNAHRIYSFGQVASYFQELELREFSLVPDDWAKEGFIRNATPEQADKQRYGCGCFWFVKRASIGSQLLGGATIAQLERG
jgi:Caenorhabditis protein of unknown function, DUF268